MKTSAWRARLLPLLGYAALIVAVGSGFVNCGGGGGSSGRIGPTSPSEVVGSGNVVQQSREVSGFTGIRLEGQGDIFITQGAPESLMVSAEENLLPHLVSEVINGILVLSTEPGLSLRSTLPIEYFVTATVLRSTRIRGAGTVECDGLETGRLLLDISGAGTLRFSDLDARELDFRTDGSSLATISGKIRQQTIAIDGAGDYDGGDLASREAEVEISGSGSATVRVSDRLTVTISGSGCVYFIGDPVLDVSVSGSGCVEKIGG